MEIRLLKPEDVSPFTDHIVRAVAESGRGSTPIFSPRSADENWEKDAKTPLILSAWEKNLNQPGWRRSWAAFDQGRPVGHIELHTRPFPSSLHRAEIGMAVEATHRRLGIGKRLLETAIDWALKESRLDWLDLNVFAHNQPARRLYESFGFVEAGRADDFCRIDGQSVDDIHMVLRLREPAKAPAAG